MAIRQALIELSSEGLLERKRRAGTFVASRIEAPTSVRTRQAQSIGVLSGYSEKVLSESLYGILVLSGIKQALPEGGRIRIVGALSDNPDYQALSEAPVISADQALEAFDGIIALENTDNSRLNSLVRPNLPVIAIEFRGPDALYDTVSLDHQKAGYLATSHLLTLGHRRIAFAGEAPKQFSSDPVWQDRCVGYMRAMAIAGISPHLDLILDTNRSAEHLRRRLPEFHQRVQPSAYVLADANFAETMGEAMTNMGLRCPRDYSVACATGLMNKSLINPVYSRISCDYRRLGSDAVNLITARLSCPSLPPLNSQQQVSFSASESSRHLQ